MAESLKEIGTHYGALEDFVCKYYGRRVELHFLNGDVMRGRVGWFDEGDELGFDFEDLESSDGERPPYDIMGVTRSRVKAFIPLEGENTEEFIKAHF
jgi:hypothetical protein